MLPSFIVQLLKALFLHTSRTVPVCATDFSLVPTQVIKDPQCASLHTLSKALTVKHSRFKTAKAQNGGFDATGVHEREFKVDQEKYFIMVEQSRFISHSTFQACSKIAGTILEQVNKKRSKGRMNGFGKASKQVSGRSRKRIHKDPVHSSDCIAKHKFTGWGRAGGFILTLCSCCCLAAWVTPFQTWTGHKSPNWRVVLIDYWLLEAVYFLQDRSATAYYCSTNCFNTPNSVAQARHGIILDMDIRSLCKAQHQSLHSLSDGWPYKVFSTSMMRFFGQSWSHDKDSLKVLFLYDSNWTFMQNMTG